MAIGEGEYKSVVGVSDLYYAPITTDSDSAYTPGTPVLLAPLAEISAEPNVSSETQYADNGAFDTATSVGETKLTLSVTGIPLPTLAALLGLAYEETTGQVFDNEATPPYVALGFKSLKSNGKNRFYWFYKGRFEMPKETAKTKGATVDFQPQELVFTAIRTTHPFAVSATVTSTLKRVIGDEDITGFDGDDWFTSVRVPTYTPS